MHQSVQAATQSTINWAPYNQKFIFSVLEVKSSRSGCQCGWVLLRSHFLACREPSYSVLTWQGEIASFLVFLLRRPLISSWSPTLMTSCEPNYLLKAPSLNYIHRGLELKHINWGGGYWHNSKVTYSVKPFHDFLWCSPLCVSIATCISVDYSTYQIIIYLYVWHLSFHETVTSLC